MQPLALHEFHQQLGARFGTLGGTEAVLDYGDPVREYQALNQRAVFADLSFRGRLCLTGVDRVRFLHGQVTNDIKRLAPGTGCYAALVSAKGRMESDLNIYSLADELLLDFEPGLTGPVSERLQKYIVADDVQVVDVGSLYCLLTVQGPQAEAAVESAEIFPERRKEKYHVTQLSDPTLGELYLMNLPRLGTCGFDVFVPAQALAEIAAKLARAVDRIGGCAAGWGAFETTRIEAGIPRFGLDMDGGHFPQECGIEAAAVSYTKGCYIGQEVLNRIHTLGHVNRELRALKLAQDLKNLPAKGDKLFREGKEVGMLTSAVYSPKFKENIALGLVRKEASAVGTELSVRSGDRESLAQIMTIPPCCTP